MDAAAYRYRRGPVSRGEREWRAEAEALVLRSPSGRVRRHKWKDVVTVRLYQAPAPGRPWRHVFEVRTKHERPCRIENAHFAGASGYEDRTAQYLPFVRAALVQLGRSNPRARALVGDTGKRYFFLLLVGLMVAGAAAYALIATPTPLDGLPQSGLIKLLAILALPAIFWLVVLRALPRGVALDAIPERAFPQAGRA